MKIRCSSIGKIMTSSKTKGEALSQTTKTFIQGLVLKEKYGIRKEFSSKYTDKGNQCEDGCLGLVMDVLQTEFLYKNEENFSNDWLTGTPDVVTDKYLIDVKNSWSASTFPWFETECPNKDYFFQLQGYLWLTNKEEAMLCYCLSNTPIDIVQDEIRREHYRLKLMDDDIDIIDQVQKQHNFDHIPDNKRVKVYIIKRDNEVIEQIKAKVELCREYFNQLMETI